MMRFVPCCLLVPLAVACRQPGASAESGSAAPAPAETPARTPTVDAPPRPDAAGPADAPGSDAAAPAAEAEAAAEVDCGALLAEYHRLADGLNRCERDNDCSEIWPGLCPSGPFYVHREADLTPLRELGIRIDSRCVLPECEAPRELDPATCRDGRCVEGRTPPGTGNEFGSCWDYLETYLLEGVPEHGRTREHLQGISPLWVYGVGAPGVLRIEVTWTEGCSDCVMQVSEHNSGMANLVEGRRTPTEKGLTIELEATPGPYYFFGQSPSGDHAFILEATLQRADGKPASPTLNGRSWQRMCED